MIGHPLLARLLFLRLRDQQGAQCLAIHQSHQHIRLSPPRNHSGCTGTGCTLGSQDLGNHAALADTGPSPTCHGFQRRIARIGLVHELRSRITTRVCGVQALLVGQDHESIRLDQIGNQGTQRVVVAKLDFVGHDRVVLIDHRHHPQTQQRQQGGTRIQIALTISQVGMGEEHLGAAHALLPQLGFIHLGQTHLAYRSSRLQFVNLLRAGRPTQPLHTLSNSPTGDHDHFARHASIPSHQRRQLAAPFTNGGLVQATPFVCHQTGTHLDHDAAGISQYARNHVKGLFMSRRLCSKRQQLLFL